MSFIISKMKKKNVNSNTDQWYNDEEDRYGYNDGVEDNQSRRKGKYDDYSDEESYGEKTPTKSQPTFHSEVSQFEDEELYGSKNTFYDRERYGKDNVDNKTKLQKMKDLTKKLPSLKKKKRTDNGNGSNDYAFSDGEDFYGNEKNNNYGNYNENSNGRRRRGKYDFDSDEEVPQDKKPTEKTEKNDDSYGFDDDSFGKSDSKNKYGGDEDSFGDEYGDKYHDGSKKNSTKDKLKNFREGLKKRSQSFTDSIANKKKYSAGPKHKLSMSAMKNSVQQKTASPVEKFKTTKQKADDMLYNMKKSVTRKWQ